MCENRQTAEYNKSNQKKKKNICDYSLFGMKNLFKNLFGERCVNNESSLDLFALHKVSCNKYTFFLKQ